MKKENRIFVIAAVAALAVDLLVSQDAVYRLSVWDTVLILGLVTLVNLAAWRLNAVTKEGCGKAAGKLPKVSQEDRRLILSGSLVVVWLLAMIWSATIVRQHYGEWTGSVGTVTACVGLVTLAVFLGVGFHNRKATEDSILLLLMAALAMRIFYVVMTQAHLYQNDTGTLLSPLGGHLGYVRHFLDNHALPDFDPTTRHQFYQPPLYHIIAAVWTKAHTLFGVPLEAADEKLQVLSLFFSISSLGVLNKIAIRLKISEWGRFVGLSLIAFFPYDIMMSGAVNNDLLMTLLMLLCIYFTLKWYQESGLVNIILMGVTIGLAMMTKISAALIAPGVAIIMLVKAWQQRKEWKKTLGQFAAFGLCAFPLGLWYPLKCLIQYGIPLGYVPNMGMDSSQFIGMYTGTSRLFTVGDQLTELCLHWDYTQPMIDYNIPISLVKYGVFGEAAYYLSNPVVKNLGTWMFWFVAAVLVGATILWVIFFFRRQFSRIYKISLAAMILVIMASYVKFCYMYPHVCTMNIRYVMVAVYLLFLGAGAGLSEAKLEASDTKGAKILRIATTVVVVSFALLSILLNWNMEILIR